MSITQNYRYSLDTSSTKHLCPNCGQRRFVRFIDTKTGEILPDKYGRCDREQQCQHYVNPYVDGYGESNEDCSIREYRSTEFVNEVIKEASFIPLNILENSKNDYEHNSLAIFLASRYGWDDVRDLFDKYHIGTSKVFGGSPIFWQVDIEGKVRTGKVMGYNTNNGKRVKEPETQITWMHRILPLENYTLSQCFFGEHLINKYVNKPIAVVESEKTAMIASLHMEQYLWIATGGAGNFTEKQCHSLISRKVVVFPDLGKKEEWENKANNIQRKTPGLDIRVSTHLEQKTTDMEKREGYDLADYLLELLQIDSIPNEFTYYTNILNLRFFCDEFGSAFFEDGVIYASEEIDKLVGKSPDTIRKIHAVKKTFINDSQQPYILNET